MTCFDHGRPAALDRRAFTLAALGFFVVSRAMGATEDAGFKAFVEGLWPAARAAGVSRETFDQATTGLAPEPGVLAKPKAQAEFTISIPAYVGSVVTNSRVARGRAVASEAASVLRRVEEKSGVPAEIIVAILGVETNFGSGLGGADVLRVLATLAWKGHMAAKLSDEFVQALVMLEKGYITRERLRGSWAGAMGQPQFMPSAYLKFAESYSGDGAADIWTSRADAIASIGSFLSKSGWSPSTPWGVEVTIPQSFDYSTFDGDFGGWRAQGFARVDGEALPGAGAASLYMPAGARGPAFLIGDNFEVIRQYNTSDAYALSVAVLADRIAGRETPVTPWPRIAPLSTNDCKAMQTLLTQRGFYHGTIDGKLGRTSRNAVRAFQFGVGMQPADGLATKEVLARLRAP